MAWNCIVENDDIQLYKTVLPPVGVNTYYLFGRNTLIVVDPGTGARRFLEEAGKSERKKKAIILTHTHFDHIAGADEFKDFNLFVSKEAQDGLFNPSVNLSSGFSSKGFEIDKRSVLNLSRGKNRFGDFEFDAALFPGHTQGDTVFNFGPFILTGDFVFADSIGRTDFTFSDPYQMKESLKRFRQYLKDIPGETLILPGHMEHTTVEQLLKRNYFLGANF